MLELVALIILVVVGLKNLIFTITKGKLGEQFSNSSRKTKPKNTFFLLILLCQLYIKFKVNCISCVTNKKAHLV